MTMFDYIKEQSDVFRSVLANRKEVAAPFVKMCNYSMPDHLYLIASGTSFNAASASVDFIKKTLGLEVSVLPPSKVGDFYSSSPFLVFISQGGNSTNTVSAIEKCKDYRYIIMTGNRKSTINELYSCCMDIPCGEETAGPKTKGYTITILTLYLMALESALSIGKITQKDYDNCINKLESVAVSFEKNIDTTISWVEKNAESLKTISNIYVVGKKEDGYIANEGALKIMETYLIPSDSFDFEEFLHGPSCSISTPVAGFYILPSPDDEDYDRIYNLVSYHRGLNNNVYTVGCCESSEQRDLVLETSGAWYTTPFEYILPFQVMSALIPPMIGLEGEGSRRFWNLNQKLRIKAKAE